MLNIDCDKFRQTFGLVCENPGNPKAETKDALYMLSILYEYPQKDLVSVIGFVCASFSEYYPVSVANSSEALSFYTFLYAEALRFNNENEEEGNFFKSLTQVQASQLLIWFEEASKYMEFQSYIDEIEFCIEKLRGWYEPRT